MQAEVAAGGAVDLLGSMRVVVGGCSVGACLAVDEPLTAVAGVLAGAEVFAADQLLLMILPVRRIAIRQTHLVGLTLSQQQHVQSENSGTAYIFGHSNMLSSEQTVSEHTCLQLSSYSLGWL